MAPKKKTTRRRRLKASTLLSLRKGAKKRRYSRRYLRVRNAVLMRDEYTCQFPECGKTGVKMIVHHIIRYSDNKALRQNKFNLITLCNNCHNKKVNGKEKKYAAIFKVIAKANARSYAKDKRTKEEILAEKRQYQQLPDSFIGYEYKSDDEIIREKKAEDYLRKTWRLIKFRTTNKNSNSYKNYGARGIKMYGPWIEDFEEFRKYILETLGERPEDSSIDRKDNDKGYEPDNLQWATDAEQGQNRRTTVLDMASASVIFILYHKYNFKQSQIVGKLGLNNPTIVRNVVLGKTWSQVATKYKQIVTDPKKLEKMSCYL